jgi:hypothetical protein
MHKELRYQAKIQAISDMPRKEKKKIQFHVISPPIKKRKLKTCFMEITS